MHLVMKCQAMNVELRRQKVFEECRLKYTKVLGKEWGDEAKRKAAVVQANREKQKKANSLVAMPTNSLVALDFSASTSKPVAETCENNNVYVRDSEVAMPTNSLKPLPSLPVPNLNQTLETYLRVLKPITSAEKYAEAELIANRFKSNSGVGQRLQQGLLSRAITTDNWAYSWWLDDMYLLNHAPLPINSNPGMVFPRAHFTTVDEQLKFAARLVSGILDYKIIIDARGLPIDRANHREKGQPLCMEQYYRLFSSYRQPGSQKDVLKITEESGSESDHIIVFSSNKMFKLHVVDGIHRLTEDDICCQLKRIVAMAQSQQFDSEGLGILTTMPRDQWASVRTQLLQDRTNAENLNSIESSIFILCLDQAIPGHESPRDDNSIALQMLHGLGSGLNSCNRWYDKTMQFVVGEDGACGLNYEHSPSEGIAVVQLIEHVLRYMDELKQRKLVRMDSNVDLPYPQKLVWNITHEIIQHMDMARFYMNKAISDLDLFLLNFEDFGKEFPKSQNMSPDCFIQLALQLTYFRIHNHLVSTYESASTRRFKLGRVDNIRAASVEALIWCESMLNPLKSMEERLDLLRDAMKAQTQYMVQTILGHGMDCHMLALKRISEEMDKTTPDLFKHETWTVCNHFTLSTSQVNTTLDSFMCYGPVVPDGYGASYNPQANSIMFCISSFKSCSETCPQKFGETLREVLREMRNMCLTVNLAANNKTDAD